MEKIKIATIEEVEQKKQVVKRLLGKTYIIRKDGDSYIVLEYMCRHQGADLTTGKEEKDIVICPRHKWKYNKNTGENIEGNGEPLKRYPIQIVGDKIFIILGSDE